MQNAILNFCRKIANFYFLATFVFIQISFYNFAFTQTDSRQNNKQEAHTLYHQAITAFQKKEWEKALQFFIQSAEKGAPPVVYYNIARCQELLGKYEEAANNYRKYLQDAPEADRKEIEEKITNLYAIPSKIILETFPSGASIYKKENGNKNKIAITPSTILLQAGSHVLLIEKEGYKHKTVTVNSGYGKIVQLKIHLQAEEKQHSNEQHLSSKKPPEKKPVHLTIGMGGGISLHLYKDVSTKAGGDFDIEFNTILGTKSLRWAVGLKFSGRFYSMDTEEDGKDNFLFISIALHPMLYYKLQNRVELTGGIPMGISILTPAGETQSTAEYKILGGSLSGGSLPFFETGINASIRIRLVTQLYLTIKPAEFRILVPLKDVFSDNKVFPQYAMALSINWEF